MRAACVSVLKQFVPRQFLALSDDTCDAPIEDFYILLLTTFAAKGEADGVPMHIDMSLVECSQAIAVIVAFVGGVADAHVGEIKQTDDRGNHLRFGEPCELQVLKHARADR